MDRLKYLRIFGLLAAAFVSFWAVANASGQLHRTPTQKWLPYANNVNLMEEWTINPVGVWDVSSQTPSGTGPTLNNYLASRWSQGTPLQGDQARAMGPRSYQSTQGFQNASAGKYLVHFNNEAAVSGDVMRLHEEQAGADLWIVGRYRVTATQSLTYAVHIGTTNTGQALPVYGIEVDQFGQNPQWVQIGTMRTVDTADPSGMPTVDVVAAIESLHDDFKDWVGWDPDKPLENHTWQDVADDVRWALDRGGDHWEFKNQQTGKPSFLAWRNRTNKDELKVMTVQQHLAIISHAVTEQLGALSSLTNIESVVTDAVTLPPPLVDEINFGELQHPVWEDVNQDLPEEVDVNTFEVQRLELNGPFDPGVPEWDGVYGNLWGWNPNFPNIGNQGLGGSSMLFQVVNPFRPVIATFWYLACWMFSAMFVFRALGGA